MHIVLTGYVNSDMFEKLLKSFDKKREDEGVVIYLYSEGGDTAIGDSIVNFINEHKDVIHLIGTGCLMSSAFSIFYEVECTKELIKNTIGMIHFSYMNVNIDETGSPKEDYDKFYISEIKKVKKHSLAFLTNLGLSAKELDEVAKGKDVYLSYKRMCELLKNQNG